MIKVSVAMALADRQEVVELDIEEGSTVEDAIMRSGVAGRFPGIDMDRAKVGLWSRPCARDTRLREGDRVEIYRPLQADPKEMRRKRARLKPSP